jgi:diphthamide biosynthesis protein 3
MADDEQVSIYDEIEIEDMTFDPNLQIYHYPCPCGDRFEIGIADLRDGEEIAVCPSCSLMIRVIFEQVKSYTRRRLISLLWRDLIGFAVLMGVCVE